MQGTAKAAARTQVRTLPLPLSSYLTETEFRNLTLMPSGDVDDLFSRVPGFVAGQLELISSDVDARLRKRYACPFAAPVPTKVRAWCVRIATRVAYLKRGIDPNDLQWQAIALDAENAEKELVEAANSETGLFDLPLRADTASTGVRAAMPRAYTEASPYVHTDVQRETAREEDRNAGGSYE